MNALHKYKNGDWYVTIHSDGTKIRQTEAVNPIATFPESTDCKITNYCDAGCSYCHENSTTKDAKSPDLTKTVELYKQLPPGVEIAIGGGNPFAHEQFDDFVKELSEHGIICNVTINEKHFPQERNRIEKLIGLGYLHGVGYSYNKIPLDWDYQNAVTHLIIGVTSYQELDSVVEKNTGKVLLLGYKNFRRGEIYLSKHERTINDNISLWYRCLFGAAKQAKLSFDNLAIEQLKPSRMYSKEDYARYYMGEDGTHTFYLDAVENKFAKSSTSYTRHDYQDNIIDMFKVIKESTNGTDKLF